MIELTINGRAFPSALLADTPYDVTVKIDGYAPISVEWSVLSGSTVILTGNGSPFRLIIPDPGGYTLHVKALGNSGHGDEAVSTLAVSSRRPVAATLGVRWGKLQVSSGDSVTGAITYNDPEGGQPTSLSWTLYWNGNLQSTGTAKTFSITSAQHGVYRIRATATDITGATVSTDSTMRVSGGYEIRPAIDPVAAETSLAFIGQIYSKSFTTAAGTVLEIPFLVASFVQDAVLLPGTSHIRFVLESNQVDDEIVVRTNMGNWALVGPPNGLTGDETLTYGYSLNSPYIPVSADRRMSYTVDQWNVHGPTYTASDFRVRIECYSATETPFFNYFPCFYSDFTGGAGNRQRRLIAVVENLALDLDSVFGKHRGGADSTVVYTTQIPNRIIATASARGTPYPVLPISGVVYTEGNVVAVYDPPAGTDLPLLESKGIYGLSGFRPYAMSLSIPREVPIVQRVRRAYGTMGVYISRGGVNAGTTITARIRTNKLPGYAEYTLPLEDVYNPDDNVFIKIGEINIDVSDYGFDLGGLAIDLTINE